MFGKISNKTANKRFEITHEDGGLGTGSRIIVDRETGVNYLYSWSGHSGGITPLLDRDGKPIISSVNI